MDLTETDPLKRTSNNEAKRRAVFQAISDTKDTLLKLCGRGELSTPVRIRIA